MKKGILLSWFLFIFGSGLALAVQNYDLREITPEVQRAIQGRQARYAELQSLKQKGVVGENNQGFVTPLKAMAGADPIVSGENQDRDVIYQAVVAQNQLGPNEISEVKKVFAEVQRGKAERGDFVQLPSGEWVQK